ncbi:MAG: hypothetical protein JJ920_04655 [Roseitalea sp.]|jgi:hypothetical protein|nr:hypothetical protein [Roseitalea sp.]MBO6721336.1 hypothetical protein [Roseitalea sp.]MBO6742179.1 hypothetical protein [Roseitalea sp.]
MKSVVGAGGVRMVFEAFTNKKPPNSVRGRMTMTIGSRQGAVHLSLSGTIAMVVI